MKTTMVLAFALVTSLGAYALEPARILDFHGISNLVDGQSGRTGTLVKYPAYTEIESKLRRAAERHPGSATLARYGQSVGGLSLNVLRIARANVRVDARPAVQISGVIHGNEYLGIEDALAEHFLDSQSSMPGLDAFLAKGGVVYFIPIVNPDGFARKRRLNDNGADLNRDFDLLPMNDMRFSQPETRALADYLERDMAASGASLKLSLDYHCCVPALITPWTYIDAQPETKDQSTFHAIGAQSRSILGYAYGNAMETVNYLAEGSSIDYFYAKYGTLALAIEGNWWGEERAFSKHVEFWDKMFQAVADQSYTQSPYIVNRRSR